MPGQRDLKQRVANNDFNRKARSWFGAWVKHFVGDTHLAKGIIRCGYQSLPQVERLAQTILEVKQKDPPPSAPVAMRHALRREALKARE